VVRALSEWLEDVRIVVVELVLSQKSQPRPRYDLVILWWMKTAISLPDETFARVEQAAKRLGVSRSEFFARAAERWLNDLEGDQLTEAINQALDDAAQETTFVSAAAEQLLHRQEW
jgi:predicted DNA-binding protein